jgi:hypothetical protein
MQPSSPLDRQKEPTGNFFLGNICLVVIINGLRMHRKRSRIRFEQLTCVGHWLVCNRSSPWQLGGKDGVCSVVPHSITIGAVDSRAVGMAARPGKVACHDAVQSV